MLHIAKDVLWIKTHLIFDLVYVFVVQKKMKVCKDRTRLRRTTRTQHTCWRGGMSARAQAPLRQRWCEAIRPTDSLNMQPV